MGMYRLTSHSSSPAAISVMTTVVSGIVFLQSFPWVGLQLEAAKPLLQLRFAECFRWFWASPWLLAVRETHTPVGRMVTPMDNLSRKDGVLDAQIKPHSQSETVRRKSEDYSTPLSDFCRVRQK